MSFDNYIMQRDKMAAFRLASISYNKELEKRYVDVEKKRNEVGKCPQNIVD